MLGLMSIVFLIFCSRIVANSNYHGLCVDFCQSALNECIDSENDNDVDLEFIKYITEIRFGAREVPTRLVELVRLYNCKSWLFKKQRVSIASKITKRRIREDDENVPLINIGGNHYFINILVVLILNLI